MTRRTVLAEGAPPALGPYSHAVVAGGLAFSSGQIGLDPGTGELVAADIRAQTARTLDNLEAILGAAGTSLARALRLTVYLADMSDFPAMNEVYATYFPAEPPARSCVAAAGLPKGARVEMDVVAAVD
jgi:2-iminobutanoate/2-iminopropanoate deaminase